MVASKFFIKILLGLKSKNLLSFLTSTGKLQPEIPSIQYHTSEALGWAAGKITAIEEELEISWCVAA